MPLDDSADTRPDFSICSSRRAARLLEQMEKSGLVSALSASGNRDLLVPKRDE